MANEREVRLRIRSVKNIAQVTIRPLGALRQKFPVFGIMIPRFLSRIFEIHHILIEGVCIPPRGRISPLLSIGVARFLVEKVH